jgi:hypothetical protein
MHIRRRRRIGFQSGLTGLNLAWMFLIWLSMVRSMTDVLSGKATFSSCAGENTRLGRVNMTRSIWNSRRVRSSVAPLIGAIQVVSFIANIGGAAPCLEPVADRIVLNDTGEGRQPARGPVLS